MAGWPALREFPCLEMQKPSRKKHALTLFPGMQILANLFGGID
jgi:hypothetical protein